MYALMYTPFFFLSALFCGFVWLFSGSVGLVRCAMRIYLSDLASELGGTYFFLLCFLSFWGREGG